MDVKSTEVRLADVKEFVERGFNELAEQKGLGFHVELNADLPHVIFTDGGRLQQVLKNLLSNAFKFTQQGDVTLTVRRAEKGRRFQNSALESASEVIAFAVADTGIGIAKDKQRLIFEAFQQADGTTNRKFGGTGLGLSISREIARLLGGQIRVESSENQGSTFTLFLPARFVPRPDAPIRAAADTGDFMSPTSQPRASGVETRPAAAPRRPSSGSRDKRRKPTGDALQYRPERRAMPQTVIDDDREHIEEGDRTVLVIENDQNFAKVLLDMARDKGYKGVVELDGQAGLQAAREIRPDAITLDIDMPGMDGLEVLDRLKRDPETRHVPVHIISGVEEKRAGLNAGAIAFLAKPVSKEALDAAFARISAFIDTVPKSLLIVEDNETQRQSIVELIAHDDVDITAVGSPEEALAKLHEKHFDCMVLDLGLRAGTDMSGFDLLEKVKSDPDNHDLPIIIYTGKELTPEDETKIKKYAETIIVKDVKSPERLLDETALFLHRIEARLPEQKRKMLEQLHDADSVVSGKSVLVVDDDVRNIFSLTSMLEDHGMIVRFAENGKQAIEQLRKDPNVDAILMDIMMPEMDGYETTRAIRAMDQFKTMPIIALTAKAMKGDREKTIAAGASDYITKPVDTEQLLSLLRVWLYR